MEIKHIYVNKFITDLQYESVQVFPLLVKNVSFTIILPP